MEPVDELTACRWTETATAWTSGLATESGAGVDLLEALAALLARTSAGSELPELPTVRVQQAGVHARADGDDV